MYSPRQPCCDLKAAVLVLAFVGTAPREASPASQKAATQEGSATWVDVPLSFEANRGQAGPSVRYLARSAEYTVLLTDDGAILAPRGMHGERGSPTAVWLRLRGGRGGGRLEGLGALEGRSHYLLGRDPRRWRVNVPHYSRVRQRNAARGVDIVYYGRGRQLEFDLVLAPGADPEKIELAFEGAQGVEIDAAGDVLVSMAVGPLRLAKPVTYQEVGGRRRAIAAEYLLKPGGGVGVRVGAFDASRPLVIDPVLSFVRRLGGAADDFAYDVTVDGAGNAYVAGKTASVNPFPFPTWVPKGLCSLSPLHCAFQTENAGATDAFVSKISPSGLLVFSTYLGGASHEWAEGLAVDSSGHAYVVGQTSSLDFPTTSSAYQPEGDCGIACTVDPPGMRHPDVFVTKLNAFGSSLAYSTYLGSPERDVGKAIAVDSLGRAFVTGETRGAGFPTKGRCRSDVLLFCAPWDSDWNGGADAFVASLDPALEGTASLLYSSYLGGSGNDSGEDIAIRELTTAQGDVLSQAYVTGGTASQGFPLVNPTQGSLRTYPEGVVSTDAFVARFNSSGSFLLFSTYLGGSAGDIGYGIAVTATGTAWVTGQTNSSDFVVRDGYQPLYGGPAGPVDLVQSPPEPPSSNRGDAFVARFDGNELVYSTFLGGAGGETGRAVALDGAGNVMVVGISNSSPPPFSVPAVRPVQEPCGPSPSCMEDGFAAKLSPDGSRLLYFTPLGGSFNDAIEAVAVDAEGRVIVAGWTNADFPGSPAQFVQHDAIVARLSDSVPGTARLSVAHCASPDPAVTCAPPDPVLEDGVLTYHVRVTNNGPDPATEVALVETIAREATLVLPLTQANCHEEALGKRLVCRIGSLAPGASATVTYSVTPNLVP